MSPRAHDERVVILAPTGQDGALAASVLGQAGLTCEIAPSLPAACVLAAEPVGALLLAEEGLDPDGVKVLAGILAAQPSWSDLPVLVLTSGGKREGQRVLELFSPHADVTLIERPIHMLTLVSLMKGALRSRRRQYLVRDLLARQEDAMRQRDAFLSIASHEMKTPLAALRLQIQAYQLALKGRGSATAATTEADRQLGSANRQIDRLARLVEDMLDVSRVETGRLALERERVELGDLVQDIVERFQPQFAVAGCALTCRAEPGLIGHWDPVRLEQIIINLFTNALKYAAGAPVEVLVARAAGDACVRVKDHGAGIALADQERVFDRFARVASGGRGLGIGLFISRELAVAHGGTLVVESEDNAGATFVLRVPLAEGAEGVQDVAPGRLI